MNRLLSALACMFIVVVLTATAAGAQTSGLCDVDLADFTDPVTGAVDIDAYFDALFGVCGDEVERPDGDGDVNAGLLARTGSNASELALAAGILVLLGTLVMLGSHRHKASAESTESCV